MTPSRASLLAVLGLSTLVWGCYRPSGAFVDIDRYVSPTGSGEEYVIVPGDTVSINVFQQEAVSTRARVRADGRISMPLINEWAAAGKTPTTLAAEIQAQLKSFINVPSVTVSVEETRPLSVSVLGEVTRPGVVVLETGSGVLPALAAAGGFTDFAHRDGVFVIRGKPGNAAPSRIRFTWKGLTTGEGRAAAFRLQPGDVVVVE